MNFDEIPKLANCQVAIHQNEGSSWGLQHGAALGHVQTLLSFP